MKILIADDNRLMLEGFRRALDRVEDIEVAGVTHSGTEVMAMIERRRPDVVALELGLRTADGRSCLQAVREEHPEVKLVVLSATASQEVIRTALSAGACAFITKNVNPLEVHVSLSGPQRKLEALGDGLTLSVKPDNLAPGVQRAKVASHDVTLPAGVQVRDIQPNSVQFSAERSVTIAVSIDAITHGRPAPGYALRSVSVQPEQVHLVLPESQRSKVRRIATESIDLQSFRTNASICFRSAVPTSFTNFRHSWFARPCSGP